MLCRVDPTQAVVQLLAMTTLPLRSRAGGVGALDFSVGGGAHVEQFAVKNTFIEVDDDIFEDDAFEADCKALACKRQVSEPVFSLARRMQAEQEWGHAKPQPHAVTPTKEQVEQSDNTSSTGSTTGCQEPETETEPQASPAAALGTVPYENAGLSHESHQCGVPYQGNAGDAALWSKQAMAWAPSGHEGMLFGFSMATPQGPRESWANASEAYEPMAMMSSCWGGESVAISSATPPVEAALPAEWTHVTTVMMRNLPNRYTQHMLMEEISAAGFNGEFDFLYLPIDPETAANKGYAFINFLGPHAAWRFRMAYEGAQMSRFNSSKFVSVSPAALQGMESNYAHYSTARCSRGDPATRPWFLREPTSVHNQRQRGSRRGGQRHRGSGRSLVDMAAQKQLEEQQRKQQPAASYGPQAPGAPHGTPMTAQFCPFCGGQVQPSFRFCQFCGAARS